MRRMRTTLIAVLVSLTAVTACERQPELRSRRGPSTRASAGLPTKPIRYDFSGDYSSHWGPVKCTQTKSKVRCVYTATKARMDCEASGKRLVCTWTERKGRGRAKFTRQANGNLIGTWGYRQSDSNRGAWMLTKK